MDPKNLGPVLADDGGRLIVLSGKTIAVHLEIYNSDSMTLAGWKTFEFSPEDAQRLIKEMEKHSLVHGIPQKTGREAWLSGDVTDAELYEWLISVDGHTQTVWDGNFPGFKIVIPRTGKEPIITKSYPSHRAGIISAYFLFYPESDQK